MAKSKYVIAKMTPTLMLLGVDKWLTRHDLLLNKHALCIFPDAATAGKMQSKLPAEIRKNTVVNNIANICKAFAISYSAQKGFFQEDFSGPMLETALQEPARSELNTFAFCASTYVECALFKIFGTVECSSGGRTKYNRTKLGLPKDHHYDALCVGSVPEQGYKDVTNDYWLSVKAMGRGSRFRGKINECGIIVVKIPKGPKRRFGFQNGDIVAADQPKGKYAGHHVGRVMTRSRGSFDIRCTDGELVGVSYKACRILQHDDGYQYCYRRALKMPIPLGN